MDGIQTTDDDPREEHLRKLRIFIGFCVALCFCMISIEIGFDLHTLLEYDDIDIQSILLVDLFFQVTLLFFSLTLLCCWIPKTGITFVYGMMLMFTNLVSVVKVLFVEINRPDRVIKFFLFLSAITICEFFLFLVTGYAIFLYTCLL